MMWSGTNSFLTSQFKYSHPHYKPLYIPCTAKYWLFLALTPIHMFISLLSSCSDPQADIVRVRPLWFILHISSLQNRKATYILCKLSFLFFLVCWVISPFGCWGVVGTIWRNSMMGIGYFGCCGPLCVSSFNWFFTSLDPFV